MPEITDYYIRIPVSKEEGKHTGHKIRTITISTTRGIKALYCSKDKVIITYLFLLSKGWTMHSAREWVENHTKKNYELILLKINKLIYIEHILLEDKISKKYEKFNWDKNIVCRKKESLIPSSTSTILLIKFIYNYLLLLCEKSIKLINKLDLEKSLTKNFEKELSPEKISIFTALLSKEFKEMSKVNGIRMWGILGETYHNGLKRGYKDLNLKDPKDWETFRGTTAYKESVLNILDSLTDDLELNIKVSVAAGVNEGLGARDIAARIREIRKAPKLVKVAEKIENGEVVRNGYEYYLSSERYAEIIGRTETLTALNSGRIDAYKKLNVNRVEWLTAGDSEVCEECEELDGQIFDINNHPEIPRHCNCRCTVTPIVE